MKLNITTTEGIKQVDAIRVFEHQGNKWFYHMDGALIAISNYDSGMLAVSGEPTMKAARYQLKINLSMAKPGFIENAKRTLALLNISYPVNN
ncbi:hypothetical protein SAMN05192529_102111 [Arachidicoccus rhizosphaerae]|uniref:Uncharacterized protein n=1 Tax=Arachidicoccus rhizosphaerae TaxID=551991 RepID=A0A1H3W5X7_9BACT|nr:hypothetical protein [Arachidicoccus rhizosphaerae]SDZ81772.1 hypothetical protein SAMN05192529_102111 [Arachidicoccus rhizosphaerae]